MRGLWQTKLPFYAVTTLALLLVFLVYRDFGFTSDESHGYRRALAVYRYYTAGEPIPFSVYHFYGAMPDIIALVLQETAGMGLYSRHLVSGLFAVLAGVFTWKLADRFIDRSNANLALIFLFLNPMWIGYAFYNLKDIPFAALLLAGFYSITKILVEERTDALSFVKVAFWVGLLATTKIIGVVILALFCVLSLAVICTVDRSKISMGTLRRVLWISAASLVGTIVMLAVFWPQLYLYTPAQIIESVLKFTRFDEWNSTVLIHGETFGIGGIPRYYLALYMAVSMPLFLLALAFISPIAVLGRYNWLAISSVVIVLFMLAFQAATNITVYGGYRHFLFLVPFIMIAAAFSAVKISRMLKGWESVGWNTWLGLCCMALAVSVVQLHPYQIVYYNSLVGGTKGADDRYYMDIWRSAGTESLRHLNNMARHENKKLKVFVCVPRINFLVFRNLEQARNIEESDYIVSSRRACRLGDYATNPAIYEVRRDGVLLSATLEGPALRAGP